MSRIIAVLVGISLLAMFVGGSVSAGDVQRALSVLGECPSLEYGVKDPVQDKDCVHALQTLLKDLGHDQEETGLFDEPTDENVRKFQRRHDIEDTGKVAAQTREALFKDSSLGDPASVLGGCPWLYHGLDDSAQGNGCVRALQLMLADLGFDQLVTGRFYERTEANVKEFQRRHNINATGVVADQTRGALLGGGSSAIPDVPQSSYSTGSCTPRRCDLYLSRAATDEYARWIADNPTLATAVAKAILRTTCARILRLSTVAIITCQILSDTQIEDVRTAVGAAADRRACLHVVFTSPEILRLQSPLAFGVDDSGRCED